MTKGTVYIIDDDGDLACSLARLIGRAGYDTKAFEEPNELHRISREAPPECVVTDVMMGVYDGFKVAEQIKAQDPRVAIIFMTAWPKSMAAVDAVRTFGGTDYLEKPIDEDRLFQSLDRAVAWSRNQKAVRERLVKLTSRELEVFHLLCRGLSNKMIAASLGIQPKTIEDHRSSIMRKTQANGLAQLIELERSL